MTRRAFVVRAGDGAEIVCTAHEPIGRARSTIVIAPNGPLPRAGPFRSMTRLADLLCDAGHRVVRADLRGFGEAEADVPEATIHEHYRSIERGLHVDDLLSVLDDARRRRRAAGALRQLRRRRHRGARGRARAAVSAPSSPTPCRSC